MQARMSPRTPVIVGVGQVVDRLGSANYGGLSAADLVTSAARLALADAGGDLVQRIDIIAGVRTLADTIPGQKAALAPFGSPANFPATVASRLGARPRGGIYSKACGDEPQRLVGEIAERIMAGEFDVGLICGAEATSTTRALQGSGKSVDWDDHTEADLDDRGSAIEHVLTPDVIALGLSAPTAYTLFENARRARLALSRDLYMQEMGTLFASFSEVAATNTKAAVRETLEASRISTPTTDNRLITDVYTKSLVARDRVNLGAAVLVVASSVADELGIGLDKRVYLAGHAHASDVPVLEREDLSGSVAMKLTYDAALEAAGITAEQIDFFDLYSCFPVAVFAGIESLELEPATSRRFTVTGGLPFFGGPGNNYSLHAIATLADRLRASPDKWGMIGANGGYFTTHAVGIYTARPVPFRAADEASLQAVVDAQRRKPVIANPSGTATVETYSVAYEKGRPVKAFVIGRMDRDDGGRFWATATDSKTVSAMQDRDPLGSRVVVEPGEKGAAARFRFIGS